jgi:hypothetical protein
VSPQDKAINVTVEHRGKSVSLPLTLGVDIPPRVNISGLVKQTKNINVYMVKYNILDSGERSAFRYSVIFKTDTDYAIYTTALANLKSF